MTTANLYGVSQFSHGHEYRFIFEEDVLRKKMHDGGLLPEEDCIDCGFPISGSNSSATSIIYLPDKLAAYNFLITPGCGPDSEDPTLEEIAEYIATVSDDYGSCTRQVAEDPGFDISELEWDDTPDGKKERVESMMAFFKEHGVTKCNGIPLDFDNPFYGISSEVRWNELCDLYDKCKVSSPDDEMI